MISEPKKSVEELARTFHSLSAFVDTDDVWRIEVRFKPAHWWWPFFRTFRADTFEGAMLKAHRNRNVRLMSKGKDEKS